MDVVRDFRRGAVRLHVLHHASEHEVTGAWMAAELAGHGYPISPGTLYPLLHDLEAADLLSSQERVEGSHAVRSYAATDQGRTTLAEARTALRELAAELLQDRGPTARQPPPASSRSANRSNLRIKEGLDHLIDQIRPDSRMRSDPRTLAAADVLIGLRSLLEETL